MYGHTYSKNIDQPGNKVANPARGQLNRENGYIFKTAIRHRVSPEFIGSHSCVSMAFTAESPPAQGQYTSR